MPFTEIRNRGTTLDLETGNQAFSFAQVRCTVHVRVAQEWGERLGSHQLSGGFETMILCETGILLLGV